MKKISFVIMAAGLFFFSSCSKSNDNALGNYTCKCTIISTVGSSYGYTYSSTSYNNTTKADATTGCNAQSSAVALQHPGSSCAIQ